MINEKSAMWQTLRETLKAEGVKKISNKQDAIEPKMSFIFNALKGVKLEDIKVVILGQDPTPQEGKATGVAFLVKHPRTVPAVLNMLLEVAFEGFSVNLDSANVEEWLTKGVLLMNAAFTVPHKPEKGKEKIEQEQKTVKGEGKKYDHRDMWRPFTKELISYISGNAPPSAWLLWGQHAQGFEPQISLHKHLIVKGRHPSPTGTAKGEGNTFFGGNYFNRANEFLEINERVAIDWSLSHTGRNGLDFSRCPQTQQALPQLQHRQNLLKDELLQTKTLINLEEQKLGHIHQRRKEISDQLQGIETTLSQSWSPLEEQKREMLTIEMHKLQHDFSDLKTRLLTHESQLQNLKARESQLQLDIQQNFYVASLPWQLLKRNYQKQINAIDKELS